MTVMYAFIVIDLAVDGVEDEWLLRYGEFSSRYW